MRNGKGQMVWHELVTTDPAAAAKFYGEIAGWKTHTGSDGVYQEWQIDGESIGGLMEISAIARTQNVPPHWLGYVGVEDVDETANRATQLGGKVHVPPTDIPNVGRFAVIADPQGAALAIFSSSSTMGASDRNATGRFSWAELNTTDWQSAWKFYSELFGWQKTSSMDMGGNLGEYFMFGTDSKTSRGGMSNAATMMNAPPHWLYYVNVVSVPESAKKIEQLGGKILYGPADIPGGDEIAQCVDPQGVHFAIYGHKKG